MICAINEGDDDVAVAHCGDGPTIRLRHNERSNHRQLLLDVLTKAGANYTDVESIVRPSIHRCHMCILSS